MKNLFILLLGFLIGCSANNLEQKNKTMHFTTDSTITTSLDSALLQESDYITGGVGNLPEKEGLYSFDYDRYYPNILDSIEVRRITTAYKMKMNPGNDIIVTILSNHGTFDQMFLCTHDSLSKLIDTYYIGKSTMYDNGKAYTIQKHIIDSNTISFEHLDLKEDPAVYEDIKMDTINHFIKKVSIDKFGRIKEK